MSAPFPDDKTVCTVLTLAARAPSLHNSQPWRWRVRKHSLNLYFDPGLHLPSTDPDSRDLMLSCGAALHHSVVALAALGWQTRIHRFPNQADPSHVAAVELYRHGASDQDIALAAAIPRRRTDRRHYSSRPVSHGDVALMGARAARAGVMLRQVDALTNLKSIVAEAIRRHATDREYLSELATWSGRYGSLAGVPARNTPTPDPTSVIPGRRFAGPVLAQTAGVSSADDGPVVLALGTEADDDLARLRAGEATSLVLLTATALGLASCPVTEPLEIAETRDEIRSDVFGDTGFPQMLLHIGWAPINADPLPASPRRPLSDTVTWVDDSTLH